MGRRHCDVVFNGFDRRVSVSIESCVGRISTLELPPMYFHLSHTSTSSCQEKLPE